MRGSHDHGWRYDIRLGPLPEDVLVLLPITCETVTSWQKDSVGVIKVEMLRCGDS